jgi:hypothetical protein
MEAEQRKLPGGGEMESGPPLTPDPSPRCGARGDRILRAQKRGEGRQNVEGATNREKRGEFLDRLYDSWNLSYFSPSLGGILVNFGRWVIKMSDRRVSVRPE